MPTSVRVRPHSGCRGSMTVMVWSGDNLWPMGVVPWLGSAPAGADARHGLGQTLAAADARHGRWPDGARLDATRGAAVPRAAVAPTSAGVRMREQGRERRVAVS